MLFLQHLRRCPAFGTLLRAARPSISGTARAASERLLAAVFQKSGVVGAHAHRFRHTLASNILAGGGTMQDVADVLGISIRVAQQSYAKWTPSRQARIDA